MAERSSRAAELAAPQDTTTSPASTRTSEPTRVLHELTEDALARGEELERLEVRRPTLEEVYLALVDDSEPT